MMTIIRLNLPQVTRI